MNLIEKKASKMKKTRDINLVKTLVEKFFMSKYRISKDCGVSWNTVQFWYKGIFTPKLDNQIKLENILNEKKNN